MGQALTRAPPHAAGERPRHEWIERAIDAPGARLRVRMEGEGPTLVLLHGWALDLDMWTPQFDALSGACRIVAFDRRGFGHSTGVPSIDDDVEDLALVLDQLSVNRAAVLGMSQGARVALRFALEAPGRTACLILDGAPSMFSPHASDLPLGAFRAIVSRDGLEAFRNVWRDHPLTRLCSQDAGARALVARMIDRYRGLDLQRRAAHSRPTAGPQDVKRIRCAALLINGALDSAERLAAAEDLAQRLPHATCVRIAGAAHLPNLDQPRQYNDALLAFVRHCARHQSEGSNA